MWSWPNFGYYSPHLPGVTEENTKKLSYYVHCVRDKYCACPEWRYKTETLQLNLSRHVLHAHPIASLLRRADYSVRRDVLSASTFSNLKGKVCLEAVSTVTQLPN